jgi:hypothetical protein
LKWAVPVALVVTPTYLYATSAAAIVAQRPGLGCLNLMVLLFVWNAMKFAVMGLLSVPMTLGEAVWRQRDRHA